MPVRPMLAFIAAFVCPANDSRFELINEDGHNGLCVVRQGCSVVQHLNEALYEDT